MGYSNKHQLLKYYKIYNLFKVLAIFCQNQNEILMLQCICKLTGDFIKKKKGA